MNGKGVELQANIPRSELPGSNTKNSILSNFIRKVKRDKWMIAMMAPGILIFIIFRYGPMLGLVTAFENYKPYLGFFRSHWVGLEHFQRFFADPSFFQLLRNTVLLGF